MNASAYLQNQGWRGLGYSLDKSNIGLAKPLLVSQKQDQAGLGTKKHDFENQWWIDAFDKTLKSLGTQKENSASTTIPHPVAGKRLDLYSSFVKSETLDSTIAVGSNQAVPVLRAEGQSSKDIVMAPSSVPMSEGVPLGENPAEAAATPKSEKEEQHKRRSSKRKHDSDKSDVISPNERKTKKTKKENGTSGGLDHTADYISLPPDDRQVGKPPPPAPPQRKKKKETAKQARARKKAERRQQNLEGAKRNKAKKEAEKAEAIANGTYVEPSPKPEPAPDPARELRGPPHPESIMALRESGQAVQLAGDKTDENHLRYMLIDALENGREGSLNKMLKRAYPTVDPNDPAQNGGVVPEKKKSYKQEKYKREKTKREAKREARLWVDIRANPHLYRPDGSYISPKERGIPLEDIKAKRQADKEARQRRNVEKQAKRQLKEQMKVERRVARKRVRAEKKIKNHIEMQAHISNKIQRQKREKDEAEAAAAGMTYEEFIEKRDKDKADEKRKRDEQLAKEQDITYEELIERRRKDHDTKEMAAEARNLGITIEEYANSKAEFSDGDVGLDNPRGAASGMGQHHGRSPIDSLWEKHKVKAEDQEQSPSGSDSGSNSDSGSDSDSDSRSSDNSDSGSEGGISLAPTSTTTPSDSTDSKNSKSVPSASGAAGDDFISLAAPPTEADSQPLYIVDTAGDASKAIDPNAPKLVKDMTRTERKARLEAIRARRAERNAALGVTKMSKKERRKRRAQRKEEILNRMTNDLMKKKKEQDRAKGSAHSDADSKAGNTSQSQNSKQERKQVRREARRIMRGMKKGTIPEAQILPEWQKRGHVNKKPKLRGNGGRDPPRPGSAEANRKTRWQWKGEA